MGNTLFNVAGRLWGVLLALFFTPYIISRIGVERYGIWALVSVVTGFLPAAAFFCFDPIINLLKIPPYLLSEAVLVFWIGLGTFCVANAASVFAAVQYGLQRMDIYNKISLAISIPNSIGIVFVLERGYGLVGLACFSRDPYYI